ncbi:MAG: hypothetical protein OEM38_04860, partial [Gammaproteobacteria bacterium]|nr:hypothetical protein [Gammaproteobacteria bacterium]
DVLANEVFEKTAISENAESESDKNILPPKLDNSDHSVTTEINVNLPETESKPNIEPKPNIDLNPIAQSLITTANKSIIGKSVSIQGLQKIFQSLNQSDFNTLRIGLVASPQIINTELSCLSRMTLIIEETGTELVLLRLPISRELTIYLVGIPLNSSLKGDQLEYITSQLSSVFINTTDSSDNDIAQLSDALTKITNTEIKLFLKDQLNIQPIKDEALHNKLEFTLIKDAGSVFIEDAAHHMDSYSQFE